MPESHNGHVGPRGRDDSWKRTVETIDKWKKRYDKVLEWKEKIGEFVTAVKRLRDPDTRVQEIVKQVRKWLPTVLTRVFRLPFAFTEHPAWKMHQEHFDFLEEAIDAFMSVEAARRSQTRASRMVADVQMCAVGILRDFRPEGKQGTRLVALLDELRFLAREEDHYTNTNSTVVIDSLIRPRRQRAEQEFDALLTDLSTRLTFLVGLEDAVRRLIAAYRAKLAELQEKRGKWAVLHRIFARLESYYNDLMGVVEGELTNGTSRNASPEYRAHHAVTRIEHLAQAWIQELDMAYRGEKGRALLDFSSSPGSP